MRAAEDVPPPSSTELRAAALAALAEAGLLYLPAHLLLADVVELGLGVSAGLPAFVALFTAGVLLACRFRSSPQTTVGAALVAVLAGVWIGRTDVFGVALGVIVALLVALRAVTLGLRDWREPIYASIGVGALVLGIETILSAGAVPQWRPALLVVVPLFFVGSLGSRAVVVWGIEEDDVAGRANPSWIRWTSLVTVGFGAILAGTSLLAVRGGVFERIGSWLSPAGNLVLSVLVTVVATLARPILWALEAIGVSPEAIREALEDWRERVDVDRAAESVTRPEAVWWSRLVGLLIFVGIAWLLYRSLRRLRADVGAFERRDEPRAGTRGVPLPEEQTRPASRGPFRRELPTDTVRRWYAEALLALRAHGLAGDPSRTPAELLPEVAAGFPDAAEGFRRLTLLYEDVRYGNRHLSGDVVHAFEPRAREVLAALRRPQAPGSPA